MLSSLNISFIWIYIAILFYSFLNFIIFIYIAILKMRPLEEKDFEEQL